MLSHLVTPRGGIVAWQLGDLALLADVPRDQAAHTLEALTATRIVRAVAMSTERRSSLRTSSSAISSRLRFSTGLLAIAPDARDCARYSIGSGEADDGPVGPRSVGFRLPGAVDGSPGRVLLGA